MKMRPVYSISIITIVIGLCVISWFAFRPRDSAPVKTQTEPRTVETSQATKITEESDDEPPQAERKKRKETLTLEERAEIAKEERLEIMRVGWGWKDGEPRMEELKRILDSPEHLEYVRKQDEKPGFNVVLWWELLEELGIPHTGRRVQETFFREYFPTGEYADYEPMMRHYIAELFLEDPSRDVTEVLRIFNADRANGIWSRGYFNGFEGEYEWGQEIQKNAASIVAEFTSLDTDTLPPATPANLAAEPKPTDVATENSGTEAVQREDTEDLTGPKQIARPIEELETKPIKDILADIPDLPTNADFETALRESFSAERLNAGMRTLTQHGLQEGLRKLKEADPELATYIEDRIQRQKEKE